MNAVTHPAGRLRGAAPLDVARVRLDFPILARLVNGQPLAYLDNAASSQHPQSVIDAVSHYYEHSHANVHRGVHALSQRAWVRERRALRKELEGARLRADHEEESRTGTLRIAMERELAAIRAQLDQLAAGQSALVVRPPTVRPLEPELIPSQPAIDRAAH